MIWLGVVVGIGVLVALVVAVLALRGRDGDVEIAEVDPLFTTGIVFAGAGVALATTIGPVMYAMLVVGLVMMAVGARRSQQHERHDQHHR